MLICPKVYEHFLRGEDFDFNPHKNDMFSFGLCFLEICAGVDTSKCYTDSGFDSALLSSLLADFTKNFERNKVLSLGLAKMLSINP